MAATPADYFFSSRMRARRMPQMKFRFTNLLIVVCCFALCGIFIRWDRSAAFGPSSYSNRQYTPPAGQLNVFQPIEGETRYVKGVAGISEQFTLTFTHNTHSQKQLWADSIPKHYGRIYSCAMGYSMSSRHSPTHYQRSRSSCAESLRVENTMRRRRIDGV